MERVRCYSILLSKFANSNIYRTMKMAKFKIWMVALTLIMGVSFTSCMDSDPTVTDITLGQVTEIFPSTVITAPYGIKFTAVNSLVDKNLTYGDYVQFQYSYNSDEQQVDQNTKNINVTIPYIEVIKTGNVIVGNSKGEEEENATILQIGYGSQNASQAQFVYYDKNTLVVPIYFLAKKEKDSHSCSLYCNVEEIKDTDTELKFYLRHYSQEEEVAEQTGYNRIYRITEALSAFKGITKKLPTKVTIYANETTDFKTDDLDKAKSELTPYSVEYPYKD